METNNKSKDVAATNSSQENQAVFEALTKVLDRTQLLEFSDESNPYWQQFSDTFGQVVKSFFELGLVAAKEFSSPLPPRYPRAYYLYGELPRSFTTKELVAKAKELGFSERSGRRYAAYLTNKGLLTHTNGNYEKHS